jgi:7-cyano-7-deazaguanine synthase
MSAIVLFSGGLDSTVNLKMALDDTGVGLALTFDYGQRASAREAAAAAFICQQLGVPHRLVSLPWLAEICGSALCAPEQPLPRLTPEELGSAAVTSGETARAVWVPNRNGVFVNIAAAYAESLAAGAIVAGFNAEEAVTFPDTSRGYVAAANAALALSTLAKPALKSYTQDLSKTEIVKLGRKIGAPLGSVWSCYTGGREDCWECESCARLARALKEAGAWEWFHTNRFVR